ncbi:S-methyl-5-thioribose-1-phosphate isomerase [Prosthecomicrobium pneumaticum]|uniref:Methylthioribose-1-phosphate isomerase n=1 Tax=Prosthecomicrobium pneumaticum TaxID=81895 RepID=A0A7W9L3B0_9HYPH|nr:S-methyl-5-thioribose-1-phosphate isomerase [Prosthecomicrobium pneumaticum]MBB5754373.1 methylthioribose-1-phosphate isomerase [Prosthecomicrobium pneumaticum]
MRVDGTSYRSIWRSGDGVTVVDQTRLPHAFTTFDIATEAAAVDAIRRMVVRGAPLIGVTGAYGLAFALREDASDAALDAAYGRLLASRPTAVNLRWALDRMLRAVTAVAENARHETALSLADALAEEDVATNEAIATHGVALVRAALEKKGGAGPVNILTHCNTGWIACVDWGTALGVIYKAHDEGLPVHVYVDETRPRNQGASLTTWELAAHGVPHTLVADNAGGHLMQEGSVDLVLVGADRVAANGDACNKIGTYLKALAAADNGVPFYVALPASTVDWSLPKGVGAIEIEERSAEEVTHIAGVTPDGAVTRVRIAPEGTKAANPAFDVTPARLISGLITERGIAPASAEGLAGLFPEQRGA